MKHSMKVKKARKRLQQIEGLLTGILDGCAKADQRVHDLLDNAKTAVSDAMTQLQKRPVRKPPARAGEPSAQRASVSARKRSGKAQNGKLESAKPKRIHAANGRTLRRTA